MADFDFFTIGVYNSTELDFFNKLIENNIDVFCDIRLRRGVRGAKYSFVNSNKLQKKLAELSIKYKHVLELAPTKEIRETQKKIDSQKQELKRERLYLGQTFNIEYESKILKNFNFNIFLEELEKVGATHVVFFCVEENTTACHRSLVTNELNKTFNFKITHL
jgi:uncharacterized protein (DUF488 family)